MTIAIASLSRSGRILQVDTPAQIYRIPRTSSSEHLSDRLRMNILFRRTGPRLGLGAHQAPVSVFLVPAERFTSIDLLARRARHQAG